MMKPKASRLTALLLCLILLFTLGACKGKADEESTEPSANVPAANVENTLPSNEESAPPETDDATAGDSITEPTQPATDVAGQKDPTNAGKEPSKPAVSDPKAPQESQPKTVAEIVAYYNKAANKIKTDKPGYSKVNVKKQFPGTKANMGVLPIPSALLNAVLGEEKTTVKKGQSSNDIFPAAGFSWASKLTAQYFNNATCTKSGSSYKIKITLKDETNPQVGKGGYGSCMSVIDKAGAQQMIGGIATIKSITMQYHDGYIMATVDIATGRITYAELYAASKMENVETNLPGKLNADVDSKETFTNFQW